MRAELVGSDRSKDTVSRNWVSKDLSGADPLAGPLTYVSRHFWHVVLGMQSFRPVQATLTGLWCR